MNADEWAALLENTKEAVSLDDIPGSSRCEARSNWSSESRKLLYRAIVHGLRQMLESSYGRRLWVVQEMLLARRVSVVAGESLLDINLLRDIERILRREGHGPFTDVFGVWDMFTEQAGTSGHRVTPVFVEDLAWRLKGQKCADPRDHIYRIIGLLNDGHTFPVDYDLALEQLFFKTLEYVHGQYKQVGQRLRYSHIDKLLRAVNVDRDTVASHTIVSHRLVWGASRAPIIDVKFTRSLKKEHGFIEREMDAKCWWAPHLFLHDDRSDPWEDRDSEVGVYEDAPYCQVDADRLSELSLEDGVNIDIAYELKDWSAFFLVEMASGGPLVVKIASDGRRRLEVPPRVRTLYIAIAQDVRAGSCGRCGYKPLRVEEMKGQLAQEIRAKLDEDPYSNSITAPLSFLALSELQVAIGQVQAAQYHKLSNIARYQSLHSTPDYRGTSPVQMMT